MNSEDLNLGIKERLKATEYSYMTKEELLTILEKIDFIAVERCNVELITGYIYDASEDKITTRTKTINIY